MFLINKYKLVEVLHKLDLIIFIICILLILKYEIGLKKGQPIRLLR